MITRVRALTIRNLAREKLLEHDSMHLPVCPKAFAETKLKIVVQSFNPPTPDISGFLMQIGNSFGIGYSKAIKSEGFQNFTVAHEIGHFVIDDHPIALLQSGAHYSRSGYISKDRFEREADMFATEFLMPWQLIDPVIRRSSPGFSAIRALADACDSSLLASAIRYSEVTKDCIAVIVSHKGVIEFMTASQQFQQIQGIDWLKKRDLLPENVPSRRFANDMDWVEASNVAEEGSNLRSWFPQARQIEVEEDVIGLGSYGRLLTLLVVGDSGEDDEDEEQETDDYIERWKEGRFRPKR